MAEGVMEGRGCGPFPAAVVPAGPSETSFYAAHYFNPFLEEKF